MLTNTSTQCRGEELVDLLADSSICLTNACYCMYSLELLMMDGKTVRNM